MPAHDGSDSIEMSPFNTSALSLDSQRSSLDEECFSRQKCEVTLYDDVPAEFEGTRSPTGGVLEAYSRHRVSDASLQRDSASENQTSPNSDELAKFKKRLESRDVLRTRWINVIGWSRSVVDTITMRHLGSHGCLDLVNLSQQILGGPTRADGDFDFIWIQTQMWFIGERAKRWSSMRSIKFRMILCLPTATQAGTLITNFAGPYHLADEVSSNCVKAILDNHPLGRGVLACPWILAFAMLRIMVEQLNFAFEIFDPTHIANGMSRVPRLDQLPGILEKANRLAHISRYLSRLEEFTSFFLSVQELLKAESAGSLPHIVAPYNLEQVRLRAKFEAERARQKILHQQNLCKSFIAPFDNLIQITISYSTAEITKRLDSGRHIAEKVAKIGLIIAAITGIVSPLSLITGYYGMNVQEFVPGAFGTLYGFWTVSLPILLFSVLVSVFLGLWLYAY